MSTRSNTQTSGTNKSGNDPAPTAKRVASIAHETIDKASGKAEEVERKLRAEADRLAEKSSETAADAKKQLDDSLNRVEGFVKERPFAAAGIAFAAGVVGALLLKR